jgi:hypothetical protein
MRSKYCILSLKGRLSFCPCLNIVPSVDCPITCSYHILFNLGAENLTNSEILKLVNDKYKIRKHLYANAKKKSRRRTRRRRQCFRHTL